MQSYFIITKKNSGNFRLKNLFQEYKTYLEESQISNDMEKKRHFVSELMQYATLYKQYIDCTLLDRDSNVEIKTNLQRLIVAIFSLDITTMIPYILYVLKNVYDVEEQDRIFKLLETYIVRCMICRVSTQSFNKLFASMITAGIQTATDLKDFLISRNTDVKMPSDIEVKDNFSCVRKTHYIPKGIL